MEMARTAQKEEEERQREEEAHRKRVQTDDEKLMQNMRDELVRKLHAAITSCSVSGVLAALKNGVDLSFTLSAKRTTCLQTAAKTRNLQMMDFLIENGARVGQQDADGQTALHYCAGNNHMDSLALLIRNEAPQLPDNAGQTPIMHAAKNGNFEPIMALLKAGGNLYHKDRANKMAVNVVPFYHPTLRRRLEQMCGWKLFEFAAKGKGNEVVALIQRGGSPRLMDEQLRSPLHHAAASGHVIIVEYMLQHGASMDGADLQGQTALHKAAIGGHAATVDALLRAGADPTLRDCSGHTAALLCQLGEVRSALEVATEEVAAKKAAEEAGHEVQAPMADATPAEQPSEGA
jgi:ankyrin repeat protein